MTAATGSTSSASRRIVALVLAALLAIVLLLAALVAWLNLRGEDSIDTNATPPLAAASPEQIARGAYLARAGNCMGCHTARGGVPYAGGRAVPTPFGDVYAPNLTPDAATGIGGWTDAQFWRALHNGRSGDGRLLYPAFPYPNYTRITRADADAIHAYLRSLAPVSQPNKPHTLRFPFDQQAALAVWRALYFRPATYEADAARSPEWNRGVYLVEGLGHCNACHASRNALGAPSSALDLAGGLIPVQNWYAPSLASSREAGIAGWPTADVMTLLKTGVSPQAAVSGPMADVVSGSTQHLSDADLYAVTSYLQTLPTLDDDAAHAAAQAASAVAVPITAGAKLYERHCVACHGERGEGVPGAYPALAGNRAVLLATPANLVHIVLEGGFAPSTAGNPRPFGMPPFATELGDNDVAALLTYLRTSWGNHAAPVSALQVTQYRGSRR
ncbi:MAG TPA: cytochrome c [Burkholderiaceae bacterium]